MAKIDEDYFKVNEGKASNDLRDILAEDESVLARLTPNKKDYILESIVKGLPIVLIWAAIDAFALYMLISQGILAQHTWALVGVIIFFAFHLMPVWLYLRNIIRRVMAYKNTLYAFTDRRVIIQTGAIGVSFKSIQYSNISSVEAKASFFDRMFKVGDIFIRCGTETVILEDVSSPYTYANKLQTIVTDLKADMAYPNDLRPKENHGYSTKYSRKIDE